MQDMGKERQMWGKKIMDYAIHKSGQLLEPNKFGLGKLLMAKQH